MGTGETFGAATVLHTAKVSDAQSVMAEKRSGSVIVLSETKKVCLTENKHISQLIFNAIFLGLLFIYICFSK